MDWTTMDLTFLMLCSSTIQLAVSLRNRLARIPTLRLGVPHILVEDGAPTDFTDTGCGIGDAEG